MKKTIIRLACICVTLLLVVGSVRPAAHAVQITDEDVLAVIAQLEAIDTLQEMQNERSNYTVKNNHYDVTTENTAIIAEHETARTGYETYVNQMFAARVAAQQAYDALSDEQKTQIDPVLVEKLSNDLPTTFKTETYSVTPRADEYTFEAVKGGTGLGYEVSNHMVSGNIPQTFILVDTSDGKTTWTPSGKYVYGESNYDVTYCCDVATNLEYGTDYRRINLEDSNYYGAAAAQHIRAILQNAYPYLTMDEMKANLKAGGLNAEFVDTLTRADIIAAVQMAVWTYANAGDDASDGLGYFASIDVPKNTGIYFTALHDYTNESWDWFPGKRQRTFDARAEYRVNTLAYYLCNLTGVAAEEDQIVISDIEVTRADLLPDTNGMYQVGMYIYLNDGGSEQDDLKITVTSYHTSEDGTVSQTSQSKQTVDGKSELQMFVKAYSGDTIEVVLEGTQKLAKGVYFYEPEGGRGASQCLVGVGEGETNVRAEESFVFSENIGEMGLRIYKTATGSGMPLSDIAFRIYRVVPGEGEALSEKPDAQEVAKYATTENFVGSVVTDVTGYGAIALEQGTYLVIEEDSDKVKSPVDPFYIMIPMTETTTSKDGTTSTNTINIVSIYPKNEPENPPEEPPVIPPTPDNVIGQFEILKYDEFDNSIVLDGAQFKVYRAATTDDTNTETVICGGTQYAVVPVVLDEEELVLTTDGNGKAVSPDLTCGTYFLVETKAPKGYILLEEAVSVTVVSNEMTAITHVEIPNKRGNILPETGGVGTMVYTIPGVLLILAAGVLFQRKKRKTF